MKFQPYLTAFTLAGLLAGAAQASHAQNLLLNGSFEDQGGSFTNWTQTLAATGSNLSIDDGSSTLFIPQDGGYYALFAAGNGQADTIDQVVPTNPDTYYDINFWVNAKYAGADLVVTWDGNQLTHLDSSYNSGAANNGWVNFDFLALASSPATDLSFASYADTALGLDNLSVTPAPEPTTLALAGIGALGLAALRRNRAR